MRSYLGAAAFAVIVVGMWACSDSEADPTTTHTEQPTAVVGFSDEYLKFCTGALSESVVTTHEVGILFNTVHFIVVNPDPVTNSDGATFSPGEKCLVESGGTMSVMAKDNDRFLVRYRMPSPASTLWYCPDGTLSFLSSEDFLALQDNMQRCYHEQANLEQEISLVRTLLTQGSAR